MASGVLVQRYKRFLADIRLPDGTLKTIHCPNTGSMKNCASPGDRAWYSTSGNPARKYPDTWELNETQAGDFIGGEYAAGQWPGASGHRAGCHASAAGILQHKG